MTLTAACKEAKLVHGTFNDSLDAYLFGVGDSVKALVEKRTSDQQWGRVGMRVNSRAGMWQEIHGPVWDVISYRYGGL